MAQDIDFSPREIFKYLKDFERKLPHHTDKEYTPLEDCNFNTNEDLTKEAQNMYSYLNMYEYTPHCSFEKLPNNVGGETVLDGHKNVIIRISDKYKNNIKPVRAILAHEVCHKYLQTHNIYYPKITKLNEVYTDLCTIYVGFGDLIVEGYNTVTKTDKDSVENILGYITPDVYLSTYSIMSVIYGKGKATHHSNREVFLNDALNTWSKSISKREIMMEQFASFENYEALLSRNSLYLLEILNQVQDKAKIKFEYANDIFFEKNPFNTENREPIFPIHLFSAIYESIVDNSGKEDTNTATDKTVAINNIIEETIVKILDICGDINVERLPNIKYECPFCGAKSNEHKFAGRTVTLKCPSCRKYFCINREKINVVGRRKIMLESEKRIINKKTILQTLSLENEKKQMAENRREELQKKYNEGIFYERKKSNERFNKRIDDFKKDLPLWAYLMPKKLLDKLKV